MKRKNKIFNLVMVAGVISAVPFNVFAQELNLFDIDWSSEMGEQGKESFDSVIKSRDGGYIVVGEIDSNPDKLAPRGDAFIGKFNSNGERVWYNELAGNDTDLFTNVLEAKDGSIYAVGKSYSSDLDFENPNTNPNAILVKFDASGNKVDLKAKSDEGKQINYTDLIESKDGEIIVVGDKVIDGVRTGFMEVLTGDKEGYTQPIQYREYTTKINDIIESSNGGYILSGSMEKPSNTENEKESVPFICEISEDFKEIWNYNTIFEEEEFLKVVNGSVNEVVLKDNGFIAVGYTNNENPDTFIISLDKNGKMEWYDINRNENYEVLNSVMINSKKEILVLKESRPNSKFDYLNDFRMTVDKYSIDGKKINSYEVNGDYNNLDTSMALMTEDDSIVVVGKMFNKVLEPNAKCDIETLATSNEECVQSDGIILKLKEKMEVENPDVEIPVLPPQENPCDVNSKPEITANEIIIYEGEDFEVFKGVIATDKEDGDITKTIVITYNDVDTSKPGEYKVIYKVSDSCGNEIEKERRVIVRKKPNKPSDVTENSQGSTEKPQTGDVGIVYAGMAIASSVGLVTVNRKKKK